MGGFFGGYTVAAWITIMVNAVGGMLVALALKLADAIVKNFSVSIAIVLTAVVSAATMGTHIGAIFALGVLFVIYAVLLYGGVLPPLLRCASCLERVPETLGVHEEVEQEPSELQELATGPLSPLSPLSESLESS